MYHILLQYSRLIIIDLTEHRVPLFLCSFYVACEP